MITRDGKIAQQPLPSFETPGLSKIDNWKIKLLKEGFERTGGSTTLGEDAYSIAKLRNSTGLCVTVADGVGGWNDSGVDPSVFSTALCYYAQQSARNRTAQSQPEGDVLQAEPRRILEDAYLAVLTEPTVQAGSSTALNACLAASTGILDCANLGDSGFAILRDSKAIHVQPSQTKYFNCPWQLAKIPIDMGDNVSDVPQDAQLFSTQLRHDDLVVLYTDGFSDNVFVRELEALVAAVSKACKGQMSEEDFVQTLANQLVRYARACSFSQTKESPFELEARRHGNADLTGGKIDDITVVALLAGEM
ncbi:uncharacterized protein L969DRAFT_96199 [Mixia osmundae IAM 14324]|uniref:Protein phosphatase n=1 Tax=Mixia osmundae (strain CBS 9802 / IAM 14324 / JCM 22182 / KY 12970) TaxID=764103 RepID=G7E4P4_MIXOS|nr:uncharacterized protein L969DRAFT_96199 [Mixia osmundae IAM 14324]KEI37679.1 hypothetical protein L969DRAFT_96199 [Mixia osmundae IAM 14324]GAA97804.1 hypothetical protein E5Q_04483 [Mixia osmundae IAM 14324]